MKITQREMILGVGTLAAALVGLTWLLVSNKSSIHKQNKLEITQLEQQIQIDKTRIKMQENWIAELNELQKDLRVFKSSQKDVSPELMKTVNAVAGKHGLVIVRSNPRNEKPTDDLFELDISYNWEGKLEALVGFLAELQQQGVRYDVRTLNVGPAGRSSGKLKGSMDISCAYIRNPSVTQK